MNYVNSVAIINMIYLKTLRDIMNIHNDPEKIYILCKRVIPMFWLVSVTLIIIGLTWGLIYTPQDRVQGDGYRIIYLHVPAAISSIVIYIFMAFCALINLIFRIKLFNWLSSSVMPIGMISTLIALVTGAIWGKPMWGTWWVWDARLTSELILLFLYSGVIALHSTFGNHRNGDNLTNILIIVGVINIPIIHYSVDWWNTLHQGTTDLHKTIDVSMRYPLRIAIVGFSMLFITLSLMQLRNIILYSEINKYWVYKYIVK